MKFMSFNTQHCLNYIERKIDFQVMSDAIKACGADVVGLNEIRSECKEDSEYANQTATLSKLTGLSNYYFAEAIKFQGIKPYGNAMLSKLPIISAETIMIPDPETKKYDGYYETRCILKARLQSDITVLITHIGLNPDEQENAVKIILENLEDKRTVLMGDFNVTPDNPLLAPIRDRLIDTARYFTEEKLSFPSDKPDRKIDYIFVTPDIEVVSADIPNIVSSDHRPHTAELKI